MRDSPLERLRAVCADDPAGEKIVLVPTYVVGQRLTDSLARTGTRWIGIRTITLDGLAHEKAAATLVRDGHSRLSRAQALAMIETACDDTLTDANYFGRLRHSVGFFRAVQRSIEDLRASRVRSTDFPADAIRNRRKSNEIRRILSRYEELLDENRFVDGPALYDIAIREAARTERRPRLFSAGLHDLTPIQRELIEALADEHVPLHEPPEDVRIHAASSHITTARGAENEIRAVVRKAVEEEKPLDSIEIVHASGEPGVPIILEVLSEFGIEATFEEGIPVPYTRPGQAILGYLDWIRNEWDATVLRKLISSGVISTGEVGPVLAARLFRNASVGWGRERHLIRMDALVREYESRVERRPDDERALRSLENVKNVRTLVQGLIDCTPPREKVVKISQLARSTARFVARYARVASDADGAAKDALLRVLDEVQSLPERNEPIASGAARLDEVVRDISVLSASSRPGAIHVSPIETAAWGSRDRIFVVGLDENFPGGGLQDPVILDEERVAINQRRREADLRLSTSRPERALRSMRSMLDRATARSITFSYSSENVLDEREALPSPFLLDLWRFLHNAPDATYQDMADALAPSREGFVATRPASAPEVWIAHAQSFLSDRGLSSSEREQVLATMRASWPW
ncbi:MAG: hypothetical protein R3338_12145, partial [Thermoanaerobaculia bacterium]|nr:hypothetical protein [Thermoanaerobaculia bacterium]